MVLNAYAKVNWHLAVGKRREDGYHPISSIFQLCSLCDVLDIEIGKGPFSIEVLGLEGLCGKGQSTLDKAAKLFSDETGFDRNVTVRLTKNIPSKAGLGGGSSDAATLLLYLNSIAEEPLDQSDLMDLASRVGCDVPFFVSCERAAYVSGLGEVIEPIEPRDLEGYIIVSETEKVSTKEAYHALDSRTEIHPLESKEYLVGMYGRPVSQWGFRNDFDMVNARPQVSIGTDEFMVLTGSGSCHALVSNRAELQLPPGMRAIKVSF